MKTLFLLYLAALVGLKHYQNVDMSFGMTKRIEANIDTHYFTSEKTELISCMVFTAFLYLFWYSACKFIIIGLLSYHGWMYESRGRTSAATRVWSMLLKLVVNPKSKLFEYQHYLPYLRLPSIGDTMQRYLRSMRPLLDDESYRRLEASADEFMNGQGFIFHLVLILKWILMPNYVSDWWEKFAYLKNRSPLVCNSNIYGLGHGGLCSDVKGIKIQQASRAANCTHALLTFRDMIRNNTLKPIWIMNNVPLCPYQYTRQFNTTRVPGESMDQLVTLNKANHIAVYSRGKWYTLNLYCKGKLMNAKELEKCFQKILEDKTECTNWEKYLGSLTAGNRTLWATTRERHFSRGVNKKSLAAIEQSAFVVCFDDESYELINEPDNRKLDEFAKAMLHGKIYDRWYDKSFNFIVSKNANIGANIEHSWGDAPVTTHLVEYVVYSDYFVTGYDENGQTRGTCRFQNLPEPTRLEWEFNADLQRTIMKCYDQALELANSVDLHIYVHDLFGKGEFKRCKTSPDAFVQMALQLAYYKDIGTSCLTYESSMTRLFRYGRTETIRSCTIESYNFVKSMVCEDFTKEERMKLFKLACEYHQSLSKEAMIGKGVDRHLFCLYIVANFLKQNSPFLNEVLSRPWRLSTSQVPTQQANLVDTKKYSSMFPLGGGFGPVNDDGYGVCYGFSGEDKIVFHVSSKLTSEKTDSYRFAQEIKSSLVAIKNLFD